MITSLLLKGIGTGLIMSIMLGPAFFVLIETSIKDGIRAGLTFDAGVITSDIVYILIAYLFIQQIEELSQGEDNAIIRGIGGILFLGYGLFTFFKKVDEKGMYRRRKKKKKPKDFVRFYIKGFLLNLANPLVVFYWFAILGFGHSGGSSPDKSWNTFLFLLFTIGTFLLIDVLKIVGAKQLRPFVTRKLLQSLNRIIGVILMGFGLFLVIHSINMWWIQ